MFFHHLCTHAICASMVYSFFSQLWPLEERWLDGGENRLKVFLLLKIISGSLSAPHFPTSSSGRKGSVGLSIHQKYAWSKVKVQAQLTLTLYRSFPAHSTVTPSISNCLYINRMTIDFYDFLSPQTATSSSSYCCSLSTVSLTSTSLTVFPFTSHRRKLSPGRRTRVSENCEWRKKRKNAFMSFSRFT